MGDRQVLHLRASRPAVCRAPILAVGWMTLAGHLSCCVAHGQISDGPRIFVTAPQVADRTRRWS